MALPSMKMRAAVSHPAPRSPSGIKNMELVFAGRPRNAWASPKYPTGSLATHLRHHNRKLKQKPPNLAAFVHAFQVRQAGTRRSLPRCLPSFLSVKVFLKGRSFRRVFVYLAPWDPSKGAARSRRWCLCPPVS